MNPTTKAWTCCGSPHEFHLSGCVHEKCCTPRKPERSPPLERHWGLVNFAERDGNYFANVVTGAGANAAVLAYSRGTNAIDTLGGLAEELARRCERIINMATGYDKE